MIDVAPFAGQPVAVFGLGRSGLASAKALMRSRAKVRAWDDSEGARGRALAEGISLADLYKCDWRELTSLILSPGIPLHHPAPHPVVKLARAADCAIIGDIELLARSQRDATYIGITGTNGKSTTTTLIGHILALSGRKTQVGGNIGKPVLELAPLGRDGAYVLEMSSFQLELIDSVAFDVGVMLNISADHIDRHGDLAGYMAAKKMIFRGLTKQRTAVVGVDDVHSEEIFQELKKAGGWTVVPISGQRRVEGGVYVIDGVLYDDRDGRNTKGADLRAVRTLPGSHNWQNAAAAYAAVRAAGVTPKVAVAGLESYPGLAHRQELIAVVDGVAYVNDSKATNADAAAKALACYAPIYWIAGGRAKDGGIDDLACLLPRVRHAFLIGEAAAPFSKTLAGKVSFTLSGDLKTAVAQARDKALADGARDATVLLSPACASYDQFKDFEARGAAFRALVEALPGTRDERGVHT